MAFLDRYRYPISKCYHTGPITLKHLHPRCACSTFWTSLNIYKNKYEKRQMCFLPHSEIKYLGHQRHQQTPELLLKNECEPLLKIMSLLKCLMKLCFAYQSSTAGLIWYLSSFLVVIFFIIPKNDLWDHTADLNNITVMWKHRLGFMILSHLCINQRVVMCFRLQLLVNVVLRCPKAVCLCVSRRTEGH